MFNKRKFAVLLSVLAVSMVFVPSGCGKEESGSESKTESSYSSVKETVSQGGTDVVISAGADQVAGIKANGYVVAQGYKVITDSSESEWYDVTAVSVGNDHIVVLKKDGTVLGDKSSPKVSILKDDGTYENPDYYDGAWDVSSWKDIVAISAGSNYTVGVKKDGTVVSTKLKNNDQNDIEKCNVSGWTDIVDVSAGEHHTVGLKKDGTVVAVGVNDKGQCNVSEWKDIKAVAAGRDITVGLKSDGTVVAAGLKNILPSDIEKLTDITAVSASSHIVALRSDGTVIALGTNNNNECNVSGWTDIVAVTAGWNNTFGLKSDGTVVKAGNGGSVKMDLSDWTLKTPNDK